MLAPVKKDMRGCNKELADAVKALEEAIARHLTKAERENATVYLQVEPCFLIWAVSHAHAAICASPHSLYLLPEPCIISVRRSCCDAILPCTLQQCTKENV